jgi:hypothetical protein
MNNYIQIEIGGKLRGLKFNQLALEVYNKNIDFERPMASAIYATFYAGLLGNCYVKREEPDFTFEQVTDWVDEIFSEKKDEIEKVCKVWEDTNVYKDWLKEWQDTLSVLLEPDKKVKKKMK